MFSLPSASDFPPDPVVLRRPELDRAYLQCRNGYKCLLISRGQHRSLAGKARDETAPLRQRLLELAAREESVRKDVYEMPEIVTALASNIEDAGDGLVDEFGRYYYGRNSYQERSPFGGLIRAGEGLEMGFQITHQSLASGGTHKGSGSVGRRPPIRQPEGLPGCWR